MPFLAQDFFENPGWCMFNAPDGGLSVVLLLLSCLAAGRKSAHPYAQGVNLMNCLRWVRAGCSWGSLQQCWGTRHRYTRDLPPGWLAVILGVLILRARFLSAYRFRHLYEEILMTFCDELMAFQRNRGRLRRFAGRLGWDKENSHAARGAPSAGREMGRDGGRFLHAAVFRPRVFPNGWTGSMCG